MFDIADYYTKATKETPFGIFPDRRRHRGDFAICVVPMLHLDLKRHEAPGSGGYFCQISDSTTSYGSYSGAVPYEKSPGTNCAPETPKFVIELGMRR
jgi:deoxyhypusine synthase